MKAVHPRAFSLPLFAIALASLHACAADSAPPPPSSSWRVNIDWSPAKGDAEGSVWQGYLVARVNFIVAHSGLYPLRAGIVAPTFDEEVEARSKVVKVYSELREKAKDLDLAYFNDLTRVEANSFMREYVWIHLHQPGWDKRPGDLRLPEFTSWSKTNLPKHQAMTKGSVRFEEVVKK